MFRLFRYLVSLTHASRIALGLWVLLLVAVSVRVAVSKPLAQTVVPIYLTAADRWQHSADLYAAIPGMDLYRNPPGVAAAFVPLTVLPWKAAGIVWRLGSAAVFLVGLSRFRRTVAPDLTPSQAGAMFALAFVLVLQSVNNGQVNTLLAGACLGGTAAVVQRKWWEAAGWFGLGFGLKIYPIAVGMLLAVTAPRRLAPRLGIVATAVAILPFFAQDAGYVIDQHRNFVTLLGLDDRTHVELRRVPRDWTILPRVWLDVVPSASTGKLVSVTAGLAMAGFVAASMWAGLPRRTTAGLALALGGTWMTLFGPATEPNTYAVLSGVAAWQAVRPTRTRWARPLAVVGFALLASAVLRGAFPNDWKFNALGPQPAGAALLLMCEVIETLAAWPTTNRPRVRRRSWALSLMSAKSEPVSV